MSLAPGGQFQGRAVGDVLVTAPEGQALELPHLPREVCRVVVVRDVQPVPLAVHGQVGGVLGQFRGGVAVEDEVVGALPGGHICQEDQAAVPHPIPVGRAADLARHLLQRPGSRVQPRHANLAEEVRGLGSARKSIRTSIGSRDRSRPCVSRRARAL